MIYRDQQKGYLSGVAAGISEYYDVPVSMVRLAFLILSPVFGFGILGYMYLTLIMADRNGQTHLNFQ